MTVLGNFIKKGLTLSAVLLGMAVMAQDAHFSQYFRSPLHTNPALTGQINGTVRINALYRSQWGSVGNDYSNTAFSADIKHNEWGFGVSIVDQVAGPNEFNTLNAALSASYDLSIASGSAASNHHFVFGLQLGVINKYVNNDNATYAGEWNSVFGHQPGTSGENLESLNLTSPDLNFGFLWFDGSPYKTFAPFAGITANHLTSPRDNFKDDNDPASAAREKSALPFRSTLHGGVRIRTSADIEITPHASVMFQNNSYNIIVGATGSYALIDTYTRVEAGVWYRVQDAIVPYFGLTHKDFQVGVSYDIVLSSLNDVGRVKNAFEVSLTYIRSKRNMKEDFICPRL
ncbi:MAG: type IX secretion system PorP/SprF family membrane protein [Luteibaculaceae bacterium]|jgi:type IX secretion system PorP/SprF family membrane protein